MVCLKIFVADMTAPFSKAGSAVHFLVISIWWDTFFPNQYSLIMVSALSEHFLVKYYISILKLVNSVLPFYCSIVKL